MERFTRLNGKYREKFGFPFILAVRNASKHIILGAFETRLHNSRNAELAAALAQVHKIAWMRIRLLVRHSPRGKLTCHVLDTARGTPAAHMRVTLRRLDQTSGAWEELLATHTNADGRLDGPALAGADMRDGEYEFTFGVGEYFSIAGVPTAGTPSCARCRCASGLTTRRRTTTSRYSARHGRTQPTAAPEPLLSCCGLEPCARASPACP